MRSNAIGRCIAAVMLAGGLAAAGSATASAADPPSPIAVTTNPANLVTLKAKCNTAVQTRLGALGADQRLINQSSSLSGTDRTALTGQVSNDVSALTQLDGAIQADATLKQTHTDCQTIVDGFRVYVLEEPKIHEVMAADTVTSANTAVAGLQPTLQQLINASGKPAANKAAAQAALNDLESKSAATRTSVSGVVASVIDQLPSGYPANEGAFKTAAQNLGASRDDLHSARADVDVVLRQVGLK